MTVQKMKARCPEQMHKSLFFVLSLSLSFFFLSFSLSLSLMFVRMMSCSRVTTVLLVETIKKQSQHRTARLVSRSHADDVLGIMDRILGVRGMTATVPEHARHSPGALSFAQVVLQHRMGKMAMIVFVFMFVFVSPPKRTGHASGLLLGLLPRLLLGMLLGLLLRLLLGMLLGMPLACSWVCS